jgi:hypothetical protein
MAADPVRIAYQIRFGEDFELDVRSYELRRAGRVRKIERIPKELLILLIEKRGQPVTRDEIVERIWGTGVFLDTGTNINAATRKIRQILKDDPEQPHFVQTITSRDTGSSRLWSSRSPFALRAAAQAQLTPEKCPAQAKERLEWATPPLQVPREFGAAEQSPVDPAAQRSAEERGYPEHPQLL